MILIFLALEESVLRDLKALLMEAKQRVPPFLATLDALTDEYLQLGGKIAMLVRQPSCWALICSSL